MQDDKQTSQPEQTPAQQAQSSPPATPADSDSTELSTEELEQRIAPFKRAYRLG